MASASAVRRCVAEVSRRLVALLEESVTPANAVQILVAEKILPSQSGANPALPLSSAIESIIPRAGIPPRSAASVGAYVRARESQGQGVAALRLLGRLKIKRARGRTSLGTIGVEFLLLLFVLLIHSLFVLPQLKAMFVATGGSMPAFTRIVFELMGSSGPLIGAIVLLLFVVFLWRVFPIPFGPLLRPIDRLLLAMPLVGSALRQRNSDRMCGWLGVAAADAPSQRAAIEAARAWFLGDLLSRECAEVLHAADGGKELTACLVEGRGFDSEFQTLVSLPDRSESLAAMRARWRIADTLPEYKDPIAPALAQIAIGIIVAAVVIALYLPIFKIGSLMM